MKRSSQALTSIFSAGCRPAGVPEGSPVVWEVELVSFEKARNWTDLDMDAVLQETVKTREQGNRLFKLGKFKFAKEKYLKVRPVAPGFGTS